MGSLFLQIGQCGCQIGVPLNHKLSSSYYCTRLRPPNRLHAIMIDTEPKVIKQILSKQPKWLDPNNLKSFEHGRGNNWSYGYLHKLPQAPLHANKGQYGKQWSHIEPTTIEKYLEENRQIAEYAIEKVRKELENIDCAMAINVLGSLGGGTGSGLGTKLVECLSQEFNINIYSHLVLPNKSGESPLQVYNCLLSLNSLIDHSSAIFTYQNDKLMSHLSTLDQKPSSLDQINSHLASNISRLININQIPNYSRFYSQMVSDCVLSPSLKFMNLFSVESKKGKWEEVFPKLGDQMRNYLGDQYAEEFGGGKARREKLLQGELLLVGNSQSKFQQKYLKKMKYMLNPLYEDSLNIEQFHTKGKDDPSQAILISNHSSILNYLNYLTSSGLKKYQAGAYLWHYQYADIQQAIHSVHNTIEQYHYTAHT